MSENREQEEQAARRLWEQVERLRSGEWQRTVRPTPEAPEAADEEAAALTRLAAEVADWMADGDSGTRRDAVRQKMWSRIAEIAPARGTAPSPSAPAARAPGWGSFLRPWHWALAGAALVAILLAPRALRPPALDPHHAALHATVVREVRQLVANTMSPDETRAAWQHMLACPGCFERYKDAWEQQHGRACAPRPANRHLVAARGR